MTLMTLTPEQALKECTPHPADEEVLVAQNPDGLAAIRSPKVKAVIWEREISPVLQRTIQSLKPIFVEHIKNRYNQSGGFWEHPGASPERIRRAFGLVPGVPLHVAWTLASDLLSLVDMLHLIGGQSRTVGGYMGKRINRFHIDGAGYNSEYYEPDKLEMNIRMHTSYTDDMALEWVPGRIAEADYFSAHRVLPGVKTEFTKAGDVIVFKGCDGDHRALKGFMRGLLHRGQNAERANDSLALVLDNKSF